MAGGNRNFFRTEEIGMQLRLSDVALSASWLNLRRGLRHGDFHVYKDCVAVLRALRQCVLDPLFRQKRFGQSFAAALSQMLLAFRASSTERAPGSAECQRLAVGELPGTFRNQKAFTSPSGHRVLLRR